MSATRHGRGTADAPERVSLVSGTARRVLYGAAPAGLAALLLGMVLDPVRGWSGLLTAAFLFLSISVGATVFLALHHVANAGWTSALKRVPEAVSAWVPFGAASMLLVIPGIHTLYHWSHAEALARDPLLAGKAPYLNVPFFVLRMVLALLVWHVFAMLLRNHSRAQDADGRVGHTRRSVTLSAVFLILFALTFCMASIDWLMSLSPHWFSTIFGFYNVAGMLQATVAFLAVAVVLLRRAGHLRQVNENHLHDVGKLLFGFSTLWAYMWFSQFMLIWYANLPEETGWYLARTHGGWEWPFYGAIVLGWALPFLLLLPRPAKRNPDHLFRVALLVLAARWLDLYVIVAPSNLETFAGFGLAELGAVVGLGASFLLVVERALNAAPLVAPNDPYLVEGLHHRQ
ncbi:MAG: hypothetical protein ACK4N5_12920 [Myxococcales bacterium]